MNGARLLAASLTTMTLLMAACGDAASSPEDVAVLPPTTPGEVQALLEQSDRPVVVNVWASWCGPCRSEAPLLRAAHQEFGDVVDILGIDVRDTQADARAFIAEFGLDGFTHLFDASGAVPDSLGGRGVPLTFFFRPGGELLTLHRGVIDERTLALHVSDLIGDP